MVFGGCSTGTKTGTRVHSDVPPERGYVRTDLSLVWFAGATPDSGLAGKWLQNDPKLTQSDLKSHS